MLYTIEVTQEDIDNGTRKNCTKCPMALAISRHLNLPPNSVTIHHYNSYIKIRNEEYRVLNGIRIRDFIESIDEGCPTKPFSCSMELIMHNGMGFIA